MRRDLSRKRNRENESTQVDGTETTEACVPLCDRDRLKGLFITIKIQTTAAREMVKKRNGTGRRASPVGHLFFYFFSLSGPLSVSISTEECKQSISLGSLRPD